MKENEIRCFDDGLTSEERWESINKKLQEIEEKGIKGFYDGFTPEESWEMIKEKVKKSKEKGTSDITFEQMLYEMEHYCDNDENKND